MLDVFEMAFPEITNSNTGKLKLEEIVPVWKAKMDDELFKKTIKHASKTLQL